MKNPMKDPISEGLLVKSCSDYLRAWILFKALDFGSLKG